MVAPAHVLLAARARRHARMRCWRMAAPGRGGMAACVQLYAQRLLARGYLPTALRGAAHRLLP